MCTGSTVSALPEAYMYTAYQKHEWERKDAFTSLLTWMCLLGYLWGLAGWNAFWNVPGSEPNPALECEVKCWRYKYRV